MKCILLTGGLGYIGSHTAVELSEAGYKLVLYDNLSNSKSSILDRLERITGKCFPFIKGDIRDASKLEQTFKIYDIDAVIHFAGLKAVGESVEQPLRYYDNNINGSLQLFKAMASSNVQKLVFSSSCTVYGEPNKLPIRENMSTGKPTNPYGMSKLMIENIINDLYGADRNLRVAILRYFNPVGAHKSGLIGEDPSGVPNNLMPFISQVAVGKRDKLFIYGNDYPTPDGSAIRDYIHVIDLALGHVAALKKLDRESEMLTVNLGTGRGYSVFQMIEAFARVNKIKIPYEVIGRRAGDVTSCYADTSYAKECLSWSAKLDLDDMCRDTWNWQKENKGYL